MNKKFDLEFCFKGNRKYVHGTDIYTQLIDKYDAHIENIDIAFHGISIKNISFYEKKPIENDIKVTFRCKNNETKIKLFGIENTSTIDCRYDYFEEKIVNNSTVNHLDETIILNSFSDYSFIEHIVAMNKSLVEELYNDIPGKWYFTRLQLQKGINITDIKSLQLILKSNFQFKLTKSLILVDNTEVGFIYFSLIPKGS